MDSFTEEAYDHVLKKMQKDIQKAAAPKLATLGIELLDVRIKRVNYNRNVVENIYQRMIS